MKPLRYLLTIIMLLFSVNAWGTTYYVDADCATPGTGTSDTCSNAADDPFQTIAQAQAAVTGDQSDNSLLFNKGNTWRECFTVGAYGTSGHPFTVGAYGTGADPILNGSVIAPEGIWIDAGSNNWVVQSVGDEIFGIWFDGTKGTVDTYPLDTVNTWAYSTDNAGSVAVYSTSNPATAFTSPGLEVAFYGYVISVDDKDYVTIDGLTLIKTNGNGITIKTSSINTIVQNCTVNNNYWAGIQIDGGTSTNVLITRNTLYENNFGVDTNGSIASSGNENIVSNNEVYDNRSAGILVSGSYGIIENNDVHGNVTDLTEDESGIHVVPTSYADDNTGDYNTVRYNKCYDTLGYETDGFGIIIDHYSDYCDVYNNICYNNNGAGIFVFKAQNTNIYNNVSYGNVQNASSTIVGEIVIWDDAVIDRTQDINIKNNIGYATEASVYAVRINEESLNNSDIVITNNLWYRASGDWYLYGDSVTGDNLATWNALALVGTDKNADPLFTDTATDDFTLKPGSPCRHGAVYLPGYITRWRPESPLPPNAVTTMNDILSIGAYGVYRGAAGM